MTLSPTSIDPKGAWLSTVGPTTGPLSPPCKATLFIQRTLLFSHIALRYNVFKEGSRFGDFSTLFIKEAIWSPTLDGLSIWGNPNRKHGSKQALEAEKVTGGPRNFGDRRSNQLNWGSMGSKWHPATFSWPSHWDFRWGRGAGRKPLLQWPVGDSTIIRFLPLHGCGGIYKVSGSPPSSLHDHTCYSQLLLEKSEKLPYYLTSRFFLVPNLQCSFLICLDY